jgi:endonuclease/exonuclease/phosphatase family metal-dependent hydrolase
MVGLFLVAPAITGAEDRGGKRDITVMTCNLYIGASLEPLLEVTSPIQVPFLVGQLFARIGLTDFPARAGAIAQQIVEQRPDVVGLQEVTLLRLQSPGDFLVGNPVQATQPVLDHLEILQRQLAARGASYSVAAIVTNWDAELPMVAESDAGFRLDDIRETDFNVILVRNDLPPGQLRVMGSASANFEATFQFTVAGVTVAFPRGWCAVDLQIRGRPIRVINTHLEDLSPVIRTAQALEIVSGPGDLDDAVICLGDFNSDPSFPGPEAYGVMAAGGFLDAWAGVYPGLPGFTWGQAEDLLNPVSSLSERLDQIWFRSARVSVEMVDVVGDDPSSRVPSVIVPQNLLWPSDHAFVVARLRVK